jgi:hypothetical protein
MTQTTKVIEAISQSEAVHLLRRELGPIREWAQFLDDSIEGERHLAGFKLLPVAKLSDGYVDHPVYDLADVRGFIASVRLALPETALDQPIQTRKLFIDLSRANWTRRRFDKNGRQITGTARAPRAPRNQRQHHDGQWGRLQ